MLKAILQFDFFGEWSYVLPNTTVSCCLAKSFKLAVRALRYDNGYSNIYKSAVLCCAKLGICSYLTKKEKKEICTSTPYIRVLMESYLTKS